MNTLKLKRFPLLLLASVLFVAFGCEDKEYQTIEELDEENIQAYIRQNNLTVARYEQTSLYYEVLEPGTGRDIDFREQYPVVYTIRSLDGAYVANDTLSAANRYADFFGYYPFGSSAANNPIVERRDDFKEVIKEVLQKTNGKIRIIVPSRLLTYGRNGNTSLGIPPNASMDYVITVHDNFEDYEDGVMRQMITRAGLDVANFEKTETNIYYHVITPGTGDVITADSTVKVNYTLKDPAGTVRDSGEEASFNLNGGVISSWPDVIPLVRKGGKIRFFTPSPRAYGIQGIAGMTGSAGITPFMSLDYEVEVLDDDE